MHRLRYAFVALFAATLVAGCAGNRRSESLTNTLTAYAAALRWNGFPQALQYVAPEYRAAHPLTPLAVARYRQVRVAGYDTGEGPRPVGTDEVRQDVKIALINRHTQHERFIIDHQVWKWDAKTHRWWLESGLPDIQRGAGTTP